jgi:hypothetical protein
MEGDRDGWEGIALDGRGSRCKPCGLHRGRWKPLSDGKSASGDWRPRDGTLDRAAQRGGSDARRAAGMAAGGVNGGCGSDARRAAEMALVASRSVRPRAWGSGRTCTAGCARLHCSHNSSRDKMINNRSMAEQYLEVQLIVDNL